MKLENTNILQFNLLPEKGKFFSPAEVFKREAPFELEIGCGKGKFLVSRAEESPERDFIGIDWSGKWMKIGDQRGSKRELKNLLFVKTEAWDFIKTIPSQSVDVFHMYFPDPWPKRRHQVRRLFTADFLKMVYTKMKPLGFFEIATDDADYYEQISRSVTEVQHLWISRRETVNERIASPHLKTNYELKFEAAGRSLRYLELQKGESSITVSYVIPKPLRRCPEKGETVL